MKLTRVLNVQSRERSSRGLFISLAAFSFSALIALYPGTHVFSGEKTGQVEKEGNHKKRKVKVAGIMFKHVRTGNYKEQNFQQAKALIHEAVKAGAQIVCTCEQFLDGYGFDANKIEDIKDKTKVDRCEELSTSKYIKQLGDIARQLNIVIVAGIAVREGTGTFNSALIFAPSGKLVGKYRKTHNAGKYARWYAPLTREQKKESCRSFDVGAGRIGIKICNDRHFRETTLYMVENGCEMILCPSFGNYDPSRLKADTKEFGIWAIFVHPKGCQFISDGKVVFEKRSEGDNGCFALYQVEFKQPGITTPIQ